MGFFDSIAGAGRSLLGGIGSGIGAVFEGVGGLLNSPVGTAAAQAFLPALAQRVAGDGSGALFQQPFPIQRTPGTFPGFQQPQQRFPSFQPQQLPFLPQATGASFFSSSSTPPGAGIMPSFTDFRTQGGGIQPVSFLPDLPFIDVLPQGSGATLGALTSPFVPTMAGARAQAFVAPNPVTGRAVWFRPAGTPLIFSRDLATCRRIEKLGRKFGSRRRPR